jgi:Xaa-Pro aminopeptidase
MVHPEDGHGKEHTNLNFCLELLGRLGTDAEEPAIRSVLLMEQNWNRRCHDKMGENQTLAYDAYRNCEGILCKNKKVGVDQVAGNWSVGDWDRIHKEMPDCEFIDLTKELDKIRAVKTFFEIEENYNTGRIMSEAFDTFNMVAKPGVRVWEAAAVAEEVLKEQGCFWGRSKYSFDLRPETIPTPLDKVFTEDDIFVFELVYTGPLGYWSEMTALYSFKPLPEPIAHQLAVHEVVIQECAAVAKTGNHIGIIAETSNRVWRENGFKIIGDANYSPNVKQLIPNGKHTPDAHTIGLDESDGPSAWFTPAEILKSNMVLSFHPSTMLEGHKAFLISDNYLVTPDGSIRLSRKTGPIDFWTKKNIYCLPDFSGRQ